MIEYEISILIAVFAFVYSNVLTEPNQIFNSLYKRLNVLFKTQERYVLGKGPHWLFKILIHCEKCIGGQIALWMYGFTHIMEYEEYPIETFFLHLAFVTFTILSVCIIKNIYTKYINNE